MTQHHPSDAMRRRTDLAVTCAASATPGFCLVLRSEPTDPDRDTSDLLLIVTVLLFLAVDAAGFTARLGPVGRHELLDADPGTRWLVVSLEGELPRTGPAAGRVRPGRFNVIICSARRALTNQA
jgi:hypothetical protein